MEYIIQVEKRIATMQSRGETVAYRRIGNKESLDITYLEPGQEKSSWIIIGLYRSIFSPIRFNIYFQARNDCRITLSFSY